MKLTVVPPRTGMAWVRAGVRTFMRQPLALSGLFFMYTALVVVVSQLPLVGPLIGGLLVPAATLGLMAASAEVESGRFPMPVVLFSAFRAGRQRLRAMLQLGLLYATGSLLASLLASLIAGTPGAPPVAAPPAEGAVNPLDGATFVALVLHLPLFVLFWHAPALVHWHGISPAKSLFFSAVAVWRNFGAHLVYGLGWIGIFLAVGSVFGLGGSLLGGTAFAQALMLPAALLLAAMFSSSIYFTFRGSFSADAAGGPGEAPQDTPAAP